MKIYAVSKMFPTKLGRDGKPVVVEVNSMTSSKVYRVDLTYGRCSCPAWIYQKGGGRKPCKHLRALGFEENMDVSRQPEVAVEVSVKMKVMEKQVAELKQLAVEYEM